MALRDSPFDAANPESPVFGTGRFVGRVGLVRNLATRLGRRQSVLLYGGPRLGKTSLLLHLKWRLEQQRSTSPHDGPSAVYVDLREDEARKRFLAGHRDQAPVLLLDNCDHLLRPTMPRVTQLLPSKGNGGPVQAVVWAGGRAWREFIRSGQSGLKLLPVPLAVLLKGEARSLVKPDLTVDQIDSVLSDGGTHPYVLKVLRARMIADGPTADPAQTLQAVRARLATFFLACLEAVREPIERTLLDHLIVQAKPMNPREAAHALGLPTVKAAADTLCYLGLISRWNLTEGAMLHVSCRLFNEWYLGHVDKQRSLRG